MSTSSGRRDWPPEPRVDAAIPVSAGPGLIGCGAAAVTVATTIGALTLFVGGPDPSDPQTQAEYQKLIVEERSALKDGYVVRQQVLTVGARRTLRFSVTMCGAEVARPDSPCSRSKPSQGQAPPDAYRIGARIRGKLTTDANADVTLTTEAVQPVITPSDEATWTWNIKPKETGTFTLTVNFTTLREAGEDALDADKPFTTRMEVDWTWRHVGATIAEFWNASWQWIVGVAGLFGVGGVLGLRSRAKKPQRKKRR